MPTALALLTCIGAGIVGGVFYAFSTFVMKALSQLPANQGMAAMQRINAVVLNPLFLGVFMGTALLSIACLIFSFQPWSALRSPLLLTTGLLYLGGAFCVTAACNVPRNERLARLQPESPEAASYWAAYLREWTKWNHVRTAAAIAAAACSAASLAA